MFEKNSILLILHYNLHSAVHYAVNCYKLCKLNYYYQYKHVTMTITITTKIKRRILTIVVSH